MRCTTAYGDPVCTQTVFPKAEVCDGKDNDCNGDIDDIAEDGSPVGCPSWFKSPGKMKCKDATGGFKKFCDPNGSFCFNCGVTIASGGFCGRCPGETCTGIAEPECAARNLCDGTGKCSKPADCPFVAPLPRCWLPEHRGLCLKD